MGSRGQYSEFIGKYLKRINDLENPLPQDSSIFLPPREDNLYKEYKPVSLQMPKPTTQEEKDALREEYSKCLQQPATITEDTFSSDTFTEVLDGKGWVIPNFISIEECQELIKIGEDFGIGTDYRNPEERRLRTSERTGNYCNEELTMRLNKRLSEDFLKVIEKTPPFTSVRGIHPNWRIARYRDGETFPAHQDQADSVIVQHPERVRQRYTSSHTLLINLKRKGVDFDGGATRFFMEGTFTGKTVDICLPQGYALVFQQKNMFHAGMPVVGSGVKYIAQAGLLRGEPDPGVITGPVSIFKYAPGLKNY